MTHSQLHTIAKFSELATDQRFVMLVNELRNLQPISSGGDAHHVIRDAGRGEGWKQCLDKMAELLVPPSAPSSTQKPPPYANSVGVHEGNRK